MLREFGRAALISISQTSLFVDDCGSGSWFEATAISFESGENAYCSGPPSENGGQSNLPGVMSRTSPLSELARKVCVTLPSFHSVQWR